MTLVSSLTKEFLPLLPSRPYLKSRLYCFMRQLIGKRPYIVIVENMEIRYVCLILLVLLKDSF